MGNVTVVLNKRTGLATGQTARLATVTFSGTYAAGGDSYTNAQFEMGVIDAIIPLGPAVGSATTGYEVMPDLANKKLRLLGGAASGVALAGTGTAGQSATVAKVLVLGDNANA